MKTIFKTITLGGKKPDLKGVYISSWAQELLDKITYQKEKEEIELEIWTPEELGCTEVYPTTAQIFAAAKERGLEFCPSEVGPRLRKEHNGIELLIIAMEPITDRVGDPGVFCLSEGGGGLGLYAVGAHAACEWHSVVRFVFRHRKTLKPSGSSLELETLDSLTIPSELIINNVLYRKV